MGEDRRRRAELVPRAGIPITAYSPIDQARLLANSTVRCVAARRSATPAQIALASMLRQSDVVAGPKATNPDPVP